MQNKDNAGFVSLGGNWYCSGCGWNNCGCDDCANCGWSRWGCGSGCGNGCGSVVSVGAARGKCDECSGTATRARSTDCGKCDECGSAYVQLRSTDCGKCDECGSAYVQSRNTECGKCDECSGTATRARSTNCGKCDECGSNRSRSGKNRGVGMVWAAKQELDQLFDADSALSAGTLFPELHKPMNGYYPGSCGCQSDAQSAAFALWELRLYLNTHPDDRQALAIFRRLCEEAGEPSYATTFLESGCSPSDWGWTDDPWPWECQPCSKNRKGR